MPAYLHHKKLVEEFHKKQGFPLDLKLAEQDLMFGEEDILSSSASNLLITATILERFMEDNPGHGACVARAQIMIEELAETIEAMITKNEVSLLDGLADLQFVTLGTAITFGMPIEEAHLEVCRSNLTKDVRKLHQDPRLRDKGADYQPPNLKDLL